MYIISTASTMNMYILYVFMHTRLIIPSPVPMS